jgi:glycyl-tRNA synthetase
MSNMNYLKVMKPTFNKPLIGKTFTGEASHIINYLTAIGNSLDKAKEFQDEMNAKSHVEIEVNNKKQTVTKEMITFNEVEEKIYGENITPHVIEPSFGLGRIIYAILEHSYSVREGDEQRGLLSLVPLIAPVKVSVLPLRSTPELLAIIPKVVSLLKEQGLSNKVDETGM